MGLFKKITKKLNKAVKKIGKTNPLVPGGKASKQVSAVAKKALVPVVQNATAGFLGSAGSPIVEEINKAGAFAGNIQGQLQSLAGVFGGGGGSGSSSPSPEQPASSGDGGGGRDSMSTTTMVLLGVGVLAALYLFTRKK
jgi:hypothetical protein